MEMEVIKKIALIPILLIFALALIIPVNASDSWFKDSSSGTWVSDLNTHWKTSEAQEVANITWLYEPSGNFSIWDSKVRVNLQITGLGGLWQIIDLSVGNETDYIQVEMRYCLEVYSWFFGLFQGTVRSSFIWVSKLDNHTEGESVGSWSSLVVFRVVFLRYNATAIKLMLLAFDNPDNPNAMWSYQRIYTVNESCFNTPNVHLRQAVIKDYTTLIGGYIEGWKFNEGILTDGSYHEDYEVEGTMGFWDAIATELWSGLTNAWNGLTSWSSENLAWIGDLYSYLSYGLGFVVGLFQGITPYLPYFFLLYPLWFLNVVGQCVYDGSIEPLMNHLLTIYHFFANLISMIVNIAQTIWSYIKFW